VKRLGGVVRRYGCRDVEVPHWGRDKKGRRRSLSPEVQPKLCLLRATPQTWTLRWFGTSASLAGVLVSDPEISGRTFIPTEHLDEYEDVEFVSRDETNCRNS
jgi:hypothetical protein